jgi:hypothetical protein
MCTNVWSDYLKGREHLEDQGVDGRITEKYIIELGHEGVECIHGALYCVQREAFVSTVMNVWGFKKTLNFLSNYKFFKERCIRRT